MKNKKGQLRIVSLFIQVALGMVFWAVGFADQISYWSFRGIEQAGLTGFTAFLLAYMNLWIFLGLILMISIGGAMFEA